MCLQVDEAKTKKVKEKLEEWERKGYEIFYWKEVKLRGDELRSFVMEEIYKAGVKRARGRVAEKPERRSWGQPVWLIDGGAIHVWVKKKERMNDYCVTMALPVYVKAKDFVAAGRNGDLCFKKVRVKKIDYETVLTQLIKREDAAVKAAAWKLV